MTQLTLHEQETVRRQARDIMQRRLAERNTDRAAALATATLDWARIAALPIIALMATLASAIRTAATVYEIYDASLPWTIAAIAALLLTIAGDGAIYLLALVQKANALKRIRDQEPRRVRNLGDLTRGIAVRLGNRQPLQWHELPQPDHTGLVLAAAFIAVLTSNLYMGLQAIGDLNTTYPALAILVDVVFIAMPPAISLIAGHQAAAYAAEVAARHTDTTVDPLDTDEGMELLQEGLRIKLEKKRARHTLDPTAAPHSPNGRSDRAAVR